MKLVIQIPCYNEEKTLPVTFSELPKQIDGIDKIEYLVVDDGSSDNTVEVARQLGITHIVKNTKNKGLAETFMYGINACLNVGADIIVNTDGDNQYRGEDIKALVQPILKGEAEMVIGERPIDDIGHFSFVKKKLQRLGSWVVRNLSGTDTPDVTSGFRAMNRYAALRLNVVTRFSYTLETLIQAGKKNLAITYVPIRINEKTRESRLFKNIPNYIKRSIATILRIYTMYEPLKVFLSLGSVFVLVALGVSIRFLYFYFIGDGAGHIQSLIFAAIMFIVGFQVMLMGGLADMISINRRLIEDQMYKIKKMELEIQNNKNSDDKTEQ